MAVRIAYPQKQQVSVSEGEPYANCTTEELEFFVANQGRWPGETEDDWKRRVRSDTDRGEIQ